MTSVFKMDFGGSQVSAISRVFSSGVIRELASKGKSPLFARLAQQSGLAGFVAASAQVRDFFEVAYSVLRRKDNRHEYIYKTALTQNILLGRHSLRTASMLTEFRVGSRKADVVILNGTSTVYEIKSERDKLDRLKGQLAAYLAVFDQVNVITGRNHLAAVEATIPQEVGILALADSASISTIRSATSNKSFIKPSVVFESLRLTEARMILERCGHVLESVPNTCAHRFLKEHFSRLDPEQVHQAFVQVLKFTRRPRTLENVLSSVPRSLQAMAVAIPLNTRDHARFATSIDVPFKDALAWA